VDIELLVTCLIDRLNDAYRHFLTAKGHPGLDAWRQRAALLGQQVSILDGDQHHTGRFIGVDDDGRLLLEVGTNELRRIHAGDLVRGPRSTPAA
jgi:biotin-(acetyl-CoA carboxylase) ligase